MEDAAPAAGKRDAAQGILTVELLDGAEVPTEPAAGKKCDDKKTGCGAV
jgi:hypothetical protein